MPNIKSYIKKKLGKSADTSGNAQEVQHIGVINKQHSRDTQQANGSEQAERSQQAIDRQQTIERQHHSDTDRIRQGKDSRFEKFKIGFKKLGQFIPSKLPDFLFYRYERDPTTGENQKIALQKIKAEKRKSHFFNRSYKNKLFTIDPTRLNDNYGNDRIFGGFDPYHLPPLND
jgi:hypothetical protein